MTPTTTLGPERGPNASLEILEIIPIQVVKDVDFVFGKKTLVRAETDYYSGDPLQNSLPH